MPSKKVNTRSSAQKYGVPRPLTAYNLYFRDERVKILEERANGLLEVQETDNFFSVMGRLVAQRWRELPDDQKLHYKRVANEEKKRYSMQVDAMVRR